MVVTTPLTIAMPVFNGGEYLEESLTYLLNQTFDDFRIIVSDDASTDNSVEILATFARRDSRIQVFRQPTNLGGKENFSWLLRHAQSEFIMFAAQDDGWSKCYIASLLQLMQSAPDCELAVGRRHRMTKDWSFYRESRYSIADELCGFRRARALLDHATSGWFYGVFRRDAVTRAFSHAESYPSAWGHDFLVILPMLLAGTVRGDNEAIYFQRLTELSHGRYTRVAADAKLLRWKAFRGIALSMLRDSPLSEIERARLLPAILRFANAHGESLRKIFSSEIRGLFSID